MKPKLSKEITDDIRFILEGIRDGRLNHDQATIHCGTAHCVCGWKAVLDLDKLVPDKGYRYTKFDLDTEYEFIRDLMSLSDIDVPRPSEWDYAEKAWGLTPDEGYQLFASHASLKQQFGVLEKLEQGLRCWDEEGDEDYIWRQGQNDE